MDSITTNSTKCLQRRYGSPYAQFNILRQLNETINQQQGLDVDRGHLLLIAQTMTSYSETIQIGRHGAVARKHSVLSRAAYQTATRVLVNAALCEKVDELDSVFSSIIAGKLPYVGTGRVALAYDHSK